MASRSCTFLRWTAQFPNIMEPLRGTGVPLPGKKILTRKVRFVNPYRHKGMNKPDCSRSTSVAGELRYFHKLSCLYTLPISSSSIQHRRYASPQKEVPLAFGQVA